MPIILYIWNYNLQVMCTLLCSIMIIFLNKVVNVCTSGSFCNSADKIGWMHHCASAWHYVLRFCSINKKDRKLHVENKKKTPIELQNATR